MAREAEGGRQMLMYALTFHGQHYLLLSDFPCGDIDVYEKSNIAADALSSDELLHEIYPLPCAKHSSGCFICVTAELSH